jgi:hypothetical protein
MAMMVPLAPLPLADFDQYWPQQAVKRAEMHPTANSQSVMLNPTTPNANDVYSTVPKSDVFKLKQPKPTVSNMGKSLDIMA